MSLSNEPNLGPVHHALLMAWMVRETVSVLGEIPADGMLRHAVQQYGHERGARMAQRARAHGRRLDWTTYLAYGEWAAPDHPHVSETVAVSPQLHRQVSRCPWHDAWDEESLSRYGRYYCRDIDRSLVNGFNPDLELSVSRTLPAGDPCCEFVYIGYALDDADAERLSRLQAELGSTAIMPWSYHLGHLYWTTRRVFALHTGAAGEALADRGLALFEERFGPDAARLVRSYERVDFGKALVTDGALDASD